MKIKSFRDLEIWKRSINLVEFVYEITRNFPRQEMFGLISQMRRAAVSIPSNISEGFSRFHNKEYRQFLYTSLGSASELTTQLIIASKLKYIKNNEADRLLIEIDEISRMTTSLIKRL